MRVVFVPARDAGRHLYLFTPLAGICDLDRASACRPAFLGYVVPMRAELIQLAKSLGFDLCRVAPASPSANAENFRKWLAEGRHGDMAWLARDPDRRTDPNLVLPGVRSIVMLSTSYFQGDTPRKGSGRFARYAWGDDYHDLILTRLKQLDAFLVSHGGIQRVYVDTGPILEREYAAQAGIGWQGKSTMLIHEKLGPWTFLSEILTTLELTPDSPAKNRCGSCTRCMTACPTGAITAPNQLDARRCISYLTIENKGAIPEELRPLVGDRVYGCDDCLDACPWNRFAQASREHAFAMRPILAETPLREFLGWSEEEFRQAFKGSPIKRIKLPRFLRNVCVVLGNVGTAEDLPALHRAATHSDPLVAEHAVWAVARIESREVSACV